MEMEIKKLWDVPLDTKVVIPIGSRLQKGRVVKKVERMQHRYPWINNQHMTFSVPVRRVTVEYEPKYQGGYGNRISFSDDKEVMLLATEDQNV